MNPFDERLNSYLHWFGVKKKLLSKTLPSFRNIFIENLTKRILLTMKVFLLSSRQKTQVFISFRSRIIEKIVTRMNFLDGALIVAFQQWGFLVPWR